MRHRLFSFIYIMLLVLAAGFMASPAAASAPAPAAAPPAVAQVTTTGETATGLLRRYIRERSLELGLADRPTRREPPFENGLAQPRGDVFDKRARPHDRWDRPRPAHGVTSRRLDAIQDALSLSRTTATVIAVSGQIT
mgnify:CR=1 FL=1